MKLCLWRVSRTNSRLLTWDSMRSGVDDSLEGALKGAPDEGRGGRSSIAKKGNHGREP